MGFGGQLTGSRKGAAMLCVALLLAFASALIVASATAAPPEPPGYEGVASCAGSTCHGRMEADGAVVRQDELQLWQESSTPAGAHSRAFAVLSSRRSRAIAATLKLGDPTSEPTCLGCHSTPTDGARGPKFLTSDGVSCEGCHGPAGGWIASHYAVGASHADNVSRGMTPLDRPATRAGVCLDCHLGSSNPGQFVSHRMMAAGHPRISFELDLFSTLQQHHDEDADYAARKGRSDSVRMWAVGQAMAVNRQMTLFASGRGTEGAFPEFTFFDCHSCHRRIFDQEDRNLTFEVNPGRPIPFAQPPFNDENMILLSAAAKVAAPGLATRFDADVRAFHQAMGTDRATAIAAARKLAATSLTLANTLGGASGSGDMAFAIVDAIAGPASAPRFTDYQGSVQSVMAIDTLLNALVKHGRITRGAAAGIRADINRAYAAVKEPNGYRPAEFRAALGSAVRSIRALQ
ncbi:multiheme c-type cytochrome [Sphingomonas sp. AOB5]|uniref:multiheme c-type cytochrome n=1 Tax=Sphingomonas sp. AOB5 TaxID=3034017 RepID=UPI0023F7987C|nr:multiheme c-type cytochrome [Sphingomonas sp. AOB5]MDF7776412.1 multiheme c-type cytochrome [Sphingomonas sp. AOB5]